MAVSFCTRVTLLVLLQISDFRVYLRYRLVCHKDRLIVPNVDLLFIVMSLSNDLSATATSK